MSVIIRLQNLPWSANALDIRQFFNGLSIPEGGVHIVGGEQGDAFIAFSTDEDARQAFNRNNGRIKEVQISLMLSSRTEMQKVIEAARAQSYAAFLQQTAPTTQTPLLPAAVPNLHLKSGGSSSSSGGGKKRSRSRSKERRSRHRRHHRSRSRSRERRRRSKRSRSRKRSSDDNSDENDNSSNELQQQVFVPQSLPINNNNNNQMPVVGVTNLMPRGQWNQFGGKRAQFERPQGLSVSIKPFYGSYGEIRRYFHGLYISGSGIKLINNNFGQRSGLCYVQFGNHTSKTEALRRNGEMYNGAVMDIQHVTDEEFAQAVDRFVPDQNHHFQINNYNNNHEQNSAETSHNPDPIDFTCVTVENLSSYVKEQDILKLFSQRPVTNMFVTYRPRGATVAYVKFVSHTEAQNALDDRSNHMIDGKTVVVKACSNHDFDMGRPLQNDEDEPSQMHIQTDCIQLTHLPPQTSSVEVADFFSDIGIRPVKIHLISNRSTGFTGQAFCEFHAQDEAQRALSKNGVTLGQHKVVVEPIGRPEMETHLHPPTTFANGASPLPLLGSRPPLPFYPPQQPPLMRFPIRGKPRFMNCVPPEDAAPGCTVFLDNVPYKAGTKEIIEFFDGFDIGDHVSRRFNPNNTPTAEARVVFETPDQAFSAVQARNGQKIWDRPIYLKQV